MLVVYRTQGKDWDRFRDTLMARWRDLEAAGCGRLEAYRNRKHPDEWLMIQEWPDKEVFDIFAERHGPDLDREAGWVKWTDVSTWEDRVVWSPGQAPVIGISSS